MQATPKDTLTEERLNDLGTAFADCIKELYADKLPDPKFIVYMKTPKFDEQGNASSAFMYTVSDDFVDEETLDTYINSLHQPLSQCFLDKLSPNKDRDPDRNWVGYHGQVFTLGDEQVSKSGEEHPELLSLDESQWIKIIKFSQRRNWYSKIEITPGQLILTAIQLSVPEIWDILKPHLSEEIKSGNERLTELMEKIKDLPLEEILEQIREILPGLFL